MEDKLSKYKNDFKKAHGNNHVLIDNVKKIIKPIR